MNSNLIDQKELTDELVAKLVTGLNQRMSLKAQTQERAWILKRSSITKNFFGKLTLTLRRPNLIGVYAPVVPDLAKTVNVGSDHPENLTSFILTGYFTNLVMFKIWPRMHTRMFQNLEQNLVKSIIPLISKVKFKKWFRAILKGVKTSK